MTKEQYERAAEIKIETENLAKAKMFLHNAVKVYLIADGVAGQVNLDYARLNKCIEMFIDDRITELEKEFEGL